MLPDVADGQASAHSHGWRPLWDRTHAGKGDEFLFGSAVTADDGVVLVGRTARFGARPT